MTKRGITSYCCKLGLFLFYRRSVWLHPTATLAHTDSHTITTGSFLFCIFLYHQSLVYCRHKRAINTGKPQPIVLFRTNPRADSRVNCTELQLTFFFFHQTLHLMLQYTCTSHSRTLDTLSIIPSSPFLSVLGCAGLLTAPGIERSLIFNCFHLSGLSLIFIGFVCVMVPVAA